jgi:BirA family biotin operon repressor/biotin-[acetyl-CoA-carboxylase] ligase
MMDARTPYVPAASLDDRLDPAEIAREAPSIVWDRLPVVIYPEIGSTNDEAIRLVREGAPTGLLVIAEHQTAGKGRKGRRWTSPPGSGLCFSLVVHPSSPRRHWHMLSLLTSVAVARSIEESSRPVNARSSFGVDLKWPNDVLLAGKKVAGILIETADSPDGPGAAVIGVGLNVGADSVPEALEHSATSVSREAGEAIPRRRLLVAFLRHFQNEYLLFERGERRLVLEHWKEASSMWDGKDVRIYDGKTWRDAITCGLSDIGALKVRFSDGSEEAVLAADVSVRY